MKKISHQVAAIAIVTASLSSTGISSTRSHGNSSAADNAPIIFDTSPITQHTCAQLYVRDVDYRPKPRGAEISDRLYKRPVVIDYSDHSDEIDDAFGECGVV